MTITTTWAQFQAMEPRAQATRLRDVLIAVRETKPESFVQTECRYADSAQSGEYQPICLVGCAFFLLEGAPAKFNTRLEFEEFLATSGVNAMATAKEIGGLHVPTIMMLQTAQAVADNQGTWKSSVEAALGVRDAYFSLHDDV